MTLMLSRARRWVALALCLAPSACVRPDTETDKARSQCEDPFVASLYASVLEREPDASLDTWKARYADKGWTRRRVALGFLRSREFRTSYVHRVFFEYLRRSPTDAEVIEYVRRLRDGHTEEDIIASVAGSDEYFELMADSDPARLVGQLHEDILGRAPSSDELAAWLGSRVSHARIANRLLASDEYKLDLAASLYGYYFQSSPDEDALGALAQKLGSGVRTEQARASLLSSASYVPFCDAGPATEATGAKPTGAPCGDIGPEGLCKEGQSTSVYCERGQLYEETCSWGCQDGLCIDDAADSIDDGGGTEPMFACADSVTESGRCDGGVLRSCDAGEIYEEDCAADGKTCELDENGVADCVPPPTPCGEITESGTCVGEKAYFCVDDRLDWWNCTSAGKTCQVDENGAATCIGSVGEGGAP